MTSIINEDDVEKKNKNKCWSKTNSDEPIKKCAKLTAKLTTAAYKSKVVGFKLEDDQLHHLVYLLSFIHSLKNLLSQLSETYMLLMYYPAIRGWGVIGFAKKATWNLLNEYIDTHLQIIIDECPGNILQAI